MRTECHNKFLKTIIFAVSLAMSFACGEMSPTEEAEQQQSGLLESKGLPVADTALNDVAFIEVYPKGDPTDHRSTRTDAPTAVTPKNTADNGEQLADSQSELENNGEGGSSTDEQDSLADSNESSNDDKLTGSDNSRESVSDPQPADSQAIAAKEGLDQSRPSILVDETSSSELIRFHPKERRTDFNIGSHHEFKEGAYQILAKWSNNDQFKGKGKPTVQVNLNDKGQPGERCDYSDSSDGDWRAIGVFYLSKNAQIKIDNKNRSSFHVENSLKLVPMIASDVTEPENFRCLGGQIDGHGLVGWR